jgi:large subunit ribosomal protein L30
LLEFGIQNLEILNIMAKIKITQVKSGIDRPERQKLTLKALGLTKMHATVEVEATPQIVGMVRKVNHLVKVEDVKG